MKKVLLSAVALLAFGFANAQEEGKGNGGFAKGDVFVSGAFSIGSEKTGDDKSNGFEIEPKVGYFVTENIAIGGKLGYASYKAEDVFGDTDDMSALTVGAFGRYYMTPASQFSLFGQLGFDYSTIDDKLADVQENEFGLNLGLGLSYFVSNNWSIEATWAGLGYTSNDNGGSGAEKTNTFGLGADLRAISFGVNYKF
jgi:outer membrane protein